MTAKEILFKIFCIPKSFSKRLASGETQINLRKLMKDPFNSFATELSKWEEEYLLELQAKENKIISFEEEADFADLLTCPIEDDDLENVHYLFGQCMLAMTLLMPVSYMALSTPEFKKHRKMIEKAEHRYQPENPLSPVFESCFNMWTLFDVEVEKTGKVLSDLISLLNIPHIKGEVEELIERMKMTYLGVYVCIGKTEASFKLREIPSGRIIEAIFEPGWEEEIEECDVLMIRLIEDTEGGTYVQLSSPYIVKSTEDEWIEFFAEHGIDQRQSFDLEKHRTFMKKGISPDFWLNYIDSACLSVNDMVTTLEGTPLLSTKA